MQGVFRANALSQNLEKRGQHVAGGIAMGLEPVAFTTSQVAKKHQRMERSCVKTVAPT
jgi:hypothetical protein